MTTAAVQPYFSTTDFYL